MYGLIALDGTLNAKDPKGVFSNVTPFAVKSTSQSPLLGTVTSSLRFEDKNVHFVGAGKFNDTTLWVINNKGDVGIVKISANGPAVSWQHQISDFRAMISTKKQLLDLKWHTKIQKIKTKLLVLLLKIFNYLSL